MNRLTALLIAGTILLCAVSLPAFGDRAKIVGSVLDARSGVAVTVHPVSLQQGRETLVRTLTDRLGKFALEFNVKPGDPLTIHTGSTTGYLPAQGAVEPNTEIAIKVMPRWATIIGIVTDRDTARGLGDIPIQAGRGDKPLQDHWASTKTDATGVFMMKVPAFEEDDVTRPVLDLWLSINDGEEASSGHAVVVTDNLALWAWPDPTQPTRLEISLPSAAATGLTIADVLEIKLPDALKERAAAAPVAPAPVPAAPVAAPAGTSVTAPTMGMPVITQGEFIWVCPVTGQKYKVTITPID